MAKQLTIKEISQMAGVSPGTVDRILHNRGRVSQQARSKVEAVLAGKAYRTNIHKSAVPLRREYRIVVSLPEGPAGDYWDLIRKGIYNGLEEYSDINISCVNFSYDPYSPKSCRNAFRAMMDYDCDAVIMTPAYTEDAHLLCGTLDKKKIPYVFVDSDAPGLHPVASICSDQRVAGRLLGRLMSLNLGSDDEILAVYIDGLAGEHSVNTTARMKACEDYLVEVGLKGKLKELSLSIYDHAGNEKKLLSFIRSNPKIRVASSLNSHGYIISDILRGNSIDTIKVVSYDLTYDNRRCLKSGDISALICQRPETQGFEAVKSSIEYLIYRVPLNKKTMPLDIVIKENLDSYTE